MKMRFGFFLISLIGIVAACRGPASEDVPSVALGETIYKQYCLACHQADGSGVPGLYPPLESTEWVSGDKERLIRVLLEGLSDLIEVNGEPYNQDMAAHDFLSDEEIAAVLTYCRKEFTDVGPILISEVTNVREKTSP